MAFCYSFSIYHPDVWGRSKLGLRYNIMAAAQTGPYREEGYLPLQECLPLGLGPLSHQPSPELKMAQEWGLKIHRHSPRSLNTLLLDMASYCICAKARRQLPFSRASRRRQMTQDSIVSPLYPAPQDWLGCLTP